MDDLRSTPCISTPATPSMDVGPAERVNDLLEVRDRGRFDTLRPSMELSCTRTQARSKAARFDVELFRMGRETGDGGTLGLRAGRPSLTASRI